MQDSKIFSIIEKEFELEKDILEMFGKMVDLTKTESPTLELLKSVLHQPIVRYSWFHSK
jgi:hypothetical protein